MSFQSKSIREMINGMLEDDYVLPAIQRHFVWRQDQITILFDSLMKGYPIGSFLFWRVKNESLNSYQYYEFIIDFHVTDNKYNKKIKPSGTKELVAVLDGQQRLNSLLIGLKGSYTSKRPYVSKKNPNAYTKKELYLNITSMKDDGYDFRFLSKDELDKDKHDIWFKVGDILEKNISDFLISDVIADLESDKRKLSANILMKLSQVVDSKSINFFLEEEQDLDKVLNIFIRVNSGGTILSHSDLLLSTATALWEEYDAREEIEEVLNTFSSYGHGLKISSDFVMKSCLMLSDIDVKFIVKNFNRENMKTIENEWLKIKEALECTLRFVIACGYTQDTLSSHNAMLPIAYYIKKNNISGDFYNSTKHKENGKKIAAWMRKALLKKIFSGQSDTKIASYREIIRKSKDDKFPLDEIEKKLKDIKFSDDDIDVILDETVYGREAFYVLNTIFETQYNTIVHMDHLYPKSSFTKNNMKKWGFTTLEEQSEVLSWVNSLANLQLLPQGINQSKSCQQFAKWVKSLTVEERKSFLIPKMDDYSPSYFLEFCQKRNTLLRRRLVQKIL